MKGAEMHHIDKPSLICIKDRKLLMVRSKGQELFYVPGGKREGAETVSECLIREASEELGVRVDPDSMRELFSFEDQAHGKPEGTMIRFTCIAAKVIGDPIPSNEIEEMRYFSSSDLSLTPEAGGTILRKLVQLGLID